MSLFSSPASAVDLRKGSTLYPSSQLEGNSPTSNIEVEKKVELEGPEAVAAFEQTIARKGGELLKSMVFTDVYWDSEELALTSADHFLRTRDGAWELKVPRPQNGNSASVYEEIEGSRPVSRYFQTRWLRRGGKPLALPFHQDDDGFDDDDDDGDDGSNDNDGDTGGGGFLLDPQHVPAAYAPPAMMGVGMAAAAEEESCSTSSSSAVQLSPFVEFTTARRRWKIQLDGEDFSIDVDEASFGCCVAEIELMVKVQPTNPQPLPPPPSSQQSSSSLSSPSAHENLENSNNDAGGSSDESAAAAAIAAADDSSVSQAVALVEQACASLGVVGAPNQDRASKFVKFILLDPALVERTLKFAPAIL
mmetsp:Transcript_60444/g.118462  ORF Transcript_60444/g.118462 Transcript_60444/m.118462 type:complete len:362 (+) Transcript_60444:133-1218(+)